MQAECSNSRKKDGQMIRFLAMPLLLAAFAATAEDRPMAATLSLDGAGTPTIRYTLAPEDTQVWFADNTEQTHKVIRSSFWTFDTSCLALEMSRLMRLSKSCGAPEVKLKWDERERDRIYPPMVRLQNGGVLVFVQYIQPLTPDKRFLTHWKAVAPKDGVVVFRGRKSTRSIVFTPDDFKTDGRGWIYLGPDRFSEEAGGMVLVDDGVPVSIGREMNEVAPRLLEMLTVRLGVGLAQKPSFYLTWSNRERPAKSFQADIVPGSVIRITVSGKQWETASREMIASFGHTVAHEIVHFWNAGVFRPAPGAAPWVAEGNADLLATAALLAIGRIDRAEAARVLSREFNECVLMAGANSWLALLRAGWSRTPYACGAAIQLGVVAIARRRDPSVEAFTFWKDAWGASSPYYESMVQQHLDRSGSDAAATLMGQMLTGESTSLVRSLEELYRLGGMNLEARPASAEVIPKSGGGQVVAKLMMEDCGRYDIWFQDDHYLVDRSETCKSFKKGMKIRYAEGEDLQLRPLESFAAIRAACTQRKSVKLGMLDGGEVTVSCADSAAASIDAMGKLVAFDPDEVAALLIGDAHR
jgi:hypothetical protein